MLKRKVIVLLLCIFIACAIVLSSCVDLADVLDDAMNKNSPCHQPGTTWVSEDGYMTIYIDENGNGTGTYEIDGILYPFVYEENLEKLVSIIYISSTADIEDDEESSSHSRFSFRWVGHYKSEDSFVVDYPSDYMYKKSGESLRFYKKK